MDIFRKIKKVFERVTSNELSGRDVDIETPSGPRHIQIDGNKTVTTNAVPSPDFLEIERILIHHRDYSAKKLGIPPEKVHLISIGFTFVSEEEQVRKGKPGTHVAFVNGQIYKDAEARETMDVLDQIIDEYYED